MARQWSARCYGVARQREGSGQNSIGGSGVLSLRHFRLVLLIPWRVGAEESGAAKCWIYGFGRRDAARPARAAWAVQRLLAARWRGRRRSFDLLISGPRVNLLHHPYARARALMARQWSARCYGVARQREGSRQNSIGGSGVLSLRHFGLVLFIPWRVGAEESGAAKLWIYGFGRRDAARPARAAWAVQRLLAARWRGRRRSFDLLISGPPR